MHHCFSARFTVRCFIPRAALAILAGLGLGQACAAEHAWSIHDLIATKEPRPSNLFSTDYVRQVTGDTLAVFSAPVRWEKDDWMTFAAVTAAIAVSSAYDHQIKFEAQEERSRKKDTFAQNFQELGSQYSWIIIGGFASYGYFAEDSQANATACDAIAASLIASGLVTPALKITIGRVRPNTTTQTFKFKPFSGNYSFPSGHTTQAFALATVIAHHYPEWWLQVLAYGSAAMVGYARIEQDMHFTSDVVAGAAIGWSVARMIVHRHPERKTRTTAHFEIIPALGSEFSGLIVTKDF